MLALIDRPELAIADFLENGIFVGNHVTIKICKYLYTFMDINTITHKTEMTMEHITPLFLWALTGIHLLLVAIYLGAVYINPEYIDNASMAIRIFVCLFLLIRFHPFRKHTLRRFDGQIIFIAAFFLLTNEGLTQYILSNFDKMMK